MSTPPTNALGDKLFGFVLGIENINHQMKILAEGKRKIYDKVKEEKLRSASVRRVIRYRALDPTKSERDNKEADQYLRSIEQAEERAKLSAAAKPDTTTPRARDRAIGGATGEELYDEAQDETDAFNPSLESETSPHEPPPTKRWNIGDIERNEEISII